VVPADCACKLGD